MPINNRIAALQPEMEVWRHDLHMHPELRFEEVRTAQQVAKLLGEWGIEVHTGIATTGVVGVLRNGGSGRAIGLRADMDALPMPEATGLPYASVNPGVMHACGHDGHTTMLLGAAKYLAETRNFDGTVVFIFQPGEEGGAGGRIMVEEGLFTRFPCDQVYGMHNDPSLPLGEADIRDDVMMAASDRFTITIRGQGGHAARPHAGIDPVMIGAQMLTALQSIDLGVACDPINAYNDHCTMNKTLEYMAFGKPQVMFDVREGRFSAGDAARYVPETSATLLGDAILELLDDPAAREQMGRIGRARIHAELGWDRSVAQLLHAYEVALES
mgnify:CR=1 FL=1